MEGLCNCGQDEVRKMAVNVFAVAIMEWNVECVCNCSVHTLLYCTEYLFRQRGEQS